MTSTRHEKIPLTPIEREELGYFVGLSETYIMYTVAINAITATNATFSLKNSFQYDPIMIPIERSASLKTPICCHVKVYVLNRFMSCMSYVGE